MSEVKERLLSEKGEDGNKGPEMPFIYKWIIFHQPFVPVLWH